MQSPLSTISLRGNLGRSFHANDAFLHSSPSISSASPVLRPPRNFFHLVLFGQNFPTTSVIDPGVVLHVNGRRPIDAPARLWAFFFSCLNCILTTSTLILRDLCLPVVVLTTSLLASIVSPLSHRSYHCPTSQQTQWPLRGSCNPYYR